MKAQCICFPIPPQHYEFEQARDVHELSMMKRAMGGLKGFAAMSPTVLLKHVVASSRVGAESSAPSPSRPEAAGFFSAFQLSGEAIPHRAGLAAAAPGNAPHSSSSPIPAHNGALPSTAALHHLPPTFVMSSCADHMVPWHEAAEFVSALQQAGAPARHLIYNHVGHSDYVMSWKPGQSMASFDAPDANSTGAAPAGAVPPPPLQDFAKDVLKLLRRQVPLPPRPADSAQVWGGQRLEGIAHISRL